MAPKNDHARGPHSKEEPASYAAAITPADGTDLDFTTRAIYVGVAGDISVWMIGATSATLFKNVPVGILPIRVDRVLAAGTAQAAGDLVALW